MEGLDQPLSVASLGTFFNWVQAIEGDCTGGCIKLTEVCISDYR